MAIAQTGDMSPEEYAQQQALTRQQQMATLLMQQGMQQPQGQMVSGRFVPTSFFQNLVPLANLAASKYIGEKADTEQAKLAAAIRQNRRQAEQKISDFALGTPDIPTEMAGPYGQGVGKGGANVPMPIAIQEGRKPDLAAALREINTNPYGAGKELKPLIYKQMMPEPTPEERRFKAAVADGSWNVQKQGGLNSFLNQMTDKDKASLRNENIRLGMAQQELAYNTGIGAPTISGNVGGVQMPVNAMPQSNMPNAAMPQTTNFATTMPALGGATPAINMGELTQKQIQGLRGEAAEDFRKNFKNSQEALPVIKEAELLLPKSSSGGIQAGFTFLTKQAGISTEMSKADAQLKILGSKLTAQVPRFEGPQSNVDVQAYREAAGAIADSTIPYADRMAALNTVKQLQSKYAPDLYAKEFPNMGTIGTPATPPATAPMIAVNPTTNEKIQSTDGGRTWKPVPKR
jgi:hypothetical protein